jgi:hypothetical protein
MDLSFNITLGNLLSILAAIGSTVTLIYKFGKSVKTDIAEDAVADSNMENQLKWVSDTIRVHDAHINDVVLRSTALEKDIAYIKGKLSNKRHESDEE